MEPSTFAYQTQESVNLQADIDALLSLTTTLINLTQSLDAKSAVALRIAVETSALRLAQRIENQLPAVQS